ncbi:MAG: glycosyltransferase family 1 protein [Sphingobacteriia bacterium]|nr:MAG: glycosyltransferase family 1 protein [Sphingobacteriia bacterium]TAG31817.1 MAG: glycosyltransferase family 1 protein [Sphingobacteriia bacterium]TAH07826.1 MAG: glycosyltransferase family 1 protein [Sphingobacteriia bacterium]
MITNRDIIIVGQQPWDTEIGSNCKNIAAEFSKQNRVLYVNAPLDRFSMYKQKNDPKIQRRINISRGLESPLILIENNLWNLYPKNIIESINWIRSQKIFEYFNLINNKRIAKNIRYAIDQLGFKNVILFNDNDIFRSFHLKELLSPKTSVYYSRDYMLAVDYWKKHGEKLEPLLIAKSDVCVANSTYLSDYCKQYNPHSFYVGQGCEMEIFANFNGDDSPEDIKHIPFPRLGYIGALLSLRLDIDLLISIAKAKPEWSVVLVGPEDDAFLKSELHQLPNVYFLGAKPSLQLPAYIHAFDICLNPQVISEVTIGNYPRKIDEYLAMGKPVVATSTPFMEAVFNEYTYLGVSVHDYIRLCTMAMLENDDFKSDERKKFASTHTWENSVSEIYKAILSVC